MRRNNCGEQYLAISSLSSSSTRSQLHSCHFLPCSVVMAEAFLQLMLDNLSSLIQREIGLIMGVDQEMKKLSSTLTAIQAVLEDAEVKQLESKAVRDWLAKLNDLTYEIDDVLDECASEVSRLEYRNPRSSRYSVKKILFRHKIGRKMKEVTGKLDMIAAERGKFHLREMDVERKSNYAAARETGSILNEPQQIYGRDKEKEEIVDILVNQVSDYEQVSVLPVIGIGGLGKTTLARLVFNDEKVAEHFDAKIWVCVSDDFDLKTVIKGIIESATGSGSASDLSYPDALQRRLWELLNRKRYLLVLDDVWNDDQEKWDMLRNAITCGSRGSAVLVTTRLRKVAHIVGTLPALCLAGLSQGDCWLLFKERAFGQEKEEHPNLVPIGEQIVKRCRGVPLAAKALGGLLRFKREKKDWIHVQESEIWNLQPEDTLLLPALRLSYQHLPLELRRCFAYCAVFPKDSVISKKELIFLWIAHGYISPNGILEEEEDIGDRIWNELVLRSLFQDVRIYDGGETTFMMHDLVHDLAQSIMENKVPGIRAQCNDTSASKRKIRHVTLRKHHVAFPSSIQSEIDSPASLMNLSGLRILDASFTEIKELPSTVGDLKHLRYLNLSCTEIRRLPSAICSLWNLKILKLNYCSQLVELPKHTRFLRNLRHLLLEGCESLSEMPPKIGELSSLKTLSLFVVGHQKGNQLGELQFLNLGGKLHISHLERLEDHTDAGKANLREKENILELRLTWEGERTSKLLDEKILEALEPHTNIETIGIEGFSGRSFPQWVRKPSLVNLVSFDLENCPNCSSLPQLGELPHLKTMYLRHLVVEYIVETGDPVITKFPSLEKLRLHCLPNLKGFAKEESMEIFPCLQKLDIRECHSLILPPLPPLKKLAVKESNNITILTKPGDLTSLKIADGNIQNEVFENLTNLKSLKIYGARENTLSAQGLRGLKSLESLDIRRSETLTCLPHGWCPHLTNLRELYIVDCPEFVELPEDIGDLKSLTYLCLMSLPEMISLPGALKHIPSPYSLNLNKLPQLTELPACLRNFTSLRGLSICNCPKLKSLPHAIKEMENLEDLRIWGCPELERRCKKEKGEDWHMIAHIPNVWIDD